MRSPFLWLALLLHVVLATAYAWRTPTFEGPDENSHYEYAWHVGNARSLPLAAAYVREQGLPQVDGAALGHHPPLYYALVGAAMAAAGADDTVFGPRVNAHFGDAGAPSRYLKFLHEADPNRLLFGLRLLSVLLGAVTIVCVHRLGRLCCPDAPRVGDLAALLVACLPMFSALHGLLNNDVLATTLATATVLLLASLLRSGDLRAGRAVALGLLLTAAILTKLTTLFLLGLAGATAALLGVRAARAHRPQVVGLLAVPALVVLLGAGWWFARNHRLYGDWLAMSVHDASFQPIPAELRWHYVFGTAPWPDGVPSFLPTVFTSLLGRFGWFAVPPPAWLVAVGAVVAAAALLGLVVAAFERPRRHLPRPLWLLLLACLFVFGGALWFNLSAPQPQGRLLFPAVGPAAVLLAAGLVRLTRALGWRRYGVALLPAAALAVFFTTFAPALDPQLAPAPPDHRALVAAIVAPRGPEAIAWTKTPATDAPDAPPTLGWRDAGAPVGTRYTLYAFDADGRVWLATHEWTHGALRIDDAPWQIPTDVWSFLPRGVPLKLRLRRIPATDDEEPATLPCSPPLPISRR